MILALKSTNILKWGEGEVEEEKSRGRRTRGCGVIKTRGVFRGRGRAAEALVDEDKSIICIRQH